MTRVFGEVAGLYDDIRPGYPAELADAIVAYHGARPRSVVDVGAGTGKGTAVLLELGAPVTCVEPDPRMTAVLAAKFPQVRVVTATFEQWSPPVGGVDVIASATAWHWTDPETRNRRAHDALAPGGTLAVFHNLHEYAEPAVSHAIDEAYRAIDRQVHVRDAHWSTEDAAASGLFTGVQERQWHRYQQFTTQQYVQLTTTFSPFRRHSAEQQERTLAALTGVVDSFGGVLTMDIRTVLTLARRG